MFLFPALAAPLSSLFLCNSSRNFLNLAVKCVSCRLEPQGGLSSHSPLSSHQESRQPSTEHISMQGRACWAHGVRRADNVNIDMYIIIMSMFQTASGNESKEVRNAVNNSPLLFLILCLRVMCWLDDGMTGPCVSLNHTRVWSLTLAVVCGSSLTPLTRGWWPHTPPEHNQDKLNGSKTCWDIKTILG